MPRRGPARSVAAEDAFAERLTWERTKRGLSPGQLAALMTEAGCPMTQSAIWKIENGEPRRRITLDEAVAFARVFETTVPDLLRPLQAVASEEARRLAEKVMTAEANLVELVDTLIETFAEYLRLVVSENDVDEFALGHANAVLDASEFHDPTVQPVTPYRSLLPEHADPVGTAFHSLMEVCMQRAQEMVTRESKGAGD